MSQSLQEQLQALWPTRQRESKRTDQGGEGEALTRKEILLLFERIWPRAFFPSQRAKIVPLADRALEQAEAIAAENLADVVSRDRIRSAINIYTRSKDYKRALRNHPTVRYGLNGTPLGRPRKRKRVRKPQEKTTPQARHSAPKTATTRPAGSQKRIRLISRRGKRISIQRQCSRCSALTSPTWRYAESNVGPVHLCGRCKLQVFEQSFGKVDAMSRSVSAGAFESNRSKH